MEEQKEVDAVMGKETDEGSTSHIENDIYTMPDEFFVPIEVKSHKLMYAIISVVVLLVVFGGATAYVLLIREAPLAEEAEIDSEAVPIDEIDAVTPVHEESTVIDQVSPDAVENKNTNTLDEVEDMEEEQLILLPASIDLDGDGLTDIEEILLGIDPAVADTDGDGFFDGAELLAGYNPSTAGGTLEDSSFFKEYINEVPSFSVHVPSTWVEKRSLVEKDDIEFIALNNDTFRFTVVENSDGDTIVQWFSKTYKNRTTNELTSRTVGGRVGKESIIRREVYVPIGNFVVIIKYDVMGKKEVAHLGIFEYVLSSITF